MQLEKEAQTDLLLTNKITMGGIAYIPKSKNKNKSIKKIDI